MHKNSNDLTYNERMILSLIRRNGAMPRAALAQATNVSAQAITNLSKKLIEKGLIAEGRSIKGKVGQPSTPLLMASDGAYFLGLKIGRRLAELALVNFAGGIKFHRMEVLDNPQPNRVLSFALRGIETFMSNLPKQDQNRIIGFGIAAPFRLWDWGEELSNWRGFDLLGELEKQIDLPIFYENDASTACGAELIFGRKDLPQDFLHVYIAHFPGGGIVLDGKLRLGPTHNAGALASVQIPGGQQLLKYAGVASLEERLGRTLPPDDVGWDVPEAIEDEWAKKAGDALAFVAMAATSINDLSAVVIDGALPVKTRERLIFHTRNAMDKMPAEGIERPAVIEGTLGRNARILGAAALPLSHFFQPGGKLG